MMMIIIIITILMTWLRLPAGAGIFLFPPPQDWLCNPPHLQFSWYRGLFPEGKVTGA